MPRRLRAPLGRPFGLPLCPGLKGTRFLSFFSVPAVTDLPRVLAIPPQVHIMFSAQNSEAQSWCNTHFPPSGDVFETRLCRIANGSINVRYASLAAFFTAPFVSALHPKADVHLGSGEVFSSGFAYFHRCLCGVCVCGNRYMYITYWGPD